MYKDIYKETEKEYRFLTSDEKLLNNKDYQKISDLLHKMENNGTLELAAGFCFSLSDMIRVGLNQIGIKCRLVECQLTINYLKDNNISFIGFDGIRNLGEIGTHVAVVTETDPPFLIDGSISHRLPLPAIIEPIVKEYSNNIIIDQRYPIEQLHVTYQEKKNSVFPKFHQSSIIERINTDSKIFNDINFLKKLNYIGIGLSLFAVLNVLLKVLGVW